MRRPALLLLALALTATGLTSAGAQATEDAPSNAFAWRSQYIDTPDGESLFVDVMHPVDLPEDAGPRPVILVVSPYLGDTGGTSPVLRFGDLYDGAYGGEGIFANGWSVVQVHMRGTSGSTGCLDILGPGEQTDIVTAVEWVDDQPWADGIAMYGKSYDANAGAAALANRPAGLDAVIAQAIGPDRYRATHNRGVRLAQALLYPSATYGAAAEANFRTGSDTTYVANSVANSADCQAAFVDHYRNDESLPFWRVRDFVERAQGATIPTFITAGYLDNATNIGGGALELFNALDGPKHLWIGWWDHVRGNDVVGDRNAMGRTTWFAEITAFLERHVKGTPLSELPDYPDYTIAAQTSDGTWRTEDALPSADARMVDLDLRGGTYVDDGAGMGSADGELGAGGLVPRGRPDDPGVWTFSEPLARRTQVAGIPRATLTLAPQLPASNLVVNVYDVDLDGRATMITRGAALVNGLGEMTLDLWPTDWVLEEGHRIGVRVSDANTENYVHIPTNASVQVISGRVALPTLPEPRVSDTAGEMAPRLETYLERAPFDVSDELPAA